MRKVVVATGVGAVLLLFGWYLVPADDTCRFTPWWDNAWRARQLVHVRGVAPEVVTDFPFPVSLGPTLAHFWDGVRADGRDVRIVDCRGRELAHELEVFDAGLREMTLWVRLPAYSQSTVSDFFIYYAGPEASSDPQPAWEAPFGLVLHGAPEPAGPRRLRDSGPDRHVVVTSDGQAVSMVPGVFGPAVSLAGEQFLDVTLSSRWYLGAGDWTIEAWVQSTSPELRHPRWILSTPPALTDLFSFYMHPNGFLTLELSNRGRVADHSFVGFNPSPGQWNHVALVRDRGTVTLWLNGLRDNVALVPADVAVPDFGSRLRLGAGRSGTSDILLDEVRISPGVARSPEWMSASRLAIGAHVWGRIDTR